MSKAPDTGTFIVRGQVRWTDGKPFTAAAIQAVDRDLRGEQAIGQTTTDSDGLYQISYTSAQFSRAEKASADLVVRVMSSTGIVVTASPILFNAPPEAIINLVVDQATPGMLSEYERIIAELAPLLVNVTVAGKPTPNIIDQIADLKGDDLDFLKQETGIALSKLTALVASAVLENKVTQLRINVPAAIFYGMAREGLPTDLAALGLISQSNQRDALERAFKANLIPANLSSSLDQMLSLLQQVTIGQTLTMSPVAGQPAMAELLGIVLDKQQDQTAFLTTYANRDDRSIDLFWKGLREDSRFADRVDALQFILQLGILTQNNVPLMKELNKGFRGARDLAALDAATWTNLVNKSGLPPDAQGDTPQARTANYVNSIMSVTQAAFPNETVAQILAKSPAIKLDNSTRQAVSKFFVNSPDFDLRSMQVDDYIKKNASNVFTGIPIADQPKVIAQVKRAQRLLRVSTSADTFKALMVTGYDSAHSIVKKGKKNFKKQNAAAVGGDDIAETMYQKAESITNQSLQTFALLNDELYGIKSNAVNGYGIDGSKYAAAKAVVIKYIPNYTDLFGAQDFCECEECRSVLSPAAYLVDLLHFLDLSEPNGNGFTPYDVLIGKAAGPGQPALQGRRPDLAYLPLTCENTNTPLPYVDLVNEALESYVALGHADKAAAHDTGDTTAEELRANPQFTLDTAYNALVTSVYPCTLPFNQPIAVARAYLENLGSSRHEVLNTFQKTPSASTQAAINAEYLKITAEEYLILIGKGFDSQVVLPAVPLFKYYGLPNSNLSPLSKVPEFLSRTGIAYADLVELIKTNFFNPNYPQGEALSFFLRIPISFAALTALKNSNFPPNPASEILSALQQAGITMAELQSWSNANYQKLSKLVVLDAPNSICDLSATTLQHLDGTPLTDLELSKLHRFIRVWRKLDWSIADLDRALTALNATDITPAAINQLAQIKQLQSELNISKLQVLLSLWSPINTRGADALYSKLFLNKAALRIDSIFEPSITDGSVLTAVGLRISDHIPALLSALRVSEADINAIRSEAGLVDTPPDNPSTFAALTLASVSLLYRYASLAKALKFRINNFISLKKLTGINPFAAPDQTLQFVTMVRKVKRIGVKVETLDYLYRHAEAAPASLAPQQNAVLLLAKTLRDGLTTIAQDNLVAPDPVGNLTRAKLGLLFESNIVDQAVTMISGTTIYAAPLAALPITIAKVDQTSAIIGIDPTKLPVIVASKTAYDPTTQQLSFQGAMTTDEKATLVAASADGPYQTAINNLFQQPVTFLQNTLSGFLTDPNVEQDLLRSVASLDQDLKSVLLNASGNPTTNEQLAVTTAIAAKFAYVLTALLPYLRDQLSHAFVRQTIADALKITSAQAKLLLETVLTSQVNAKPAITDLLALATPGLSARYFTSVLLTGSSTLDTTPGTVIPSGKRSARWSGMLLAPNNGDFTFSVKTTGTVQLWVDDDTQPLTMQLDGSVQEYVSAQKISLKAGQLCNLQLEVTQLPSQNAVVELRWQSATTPKAIIPADNLYPRSTLDAMNATYTRLQKSAILVNAFKLNEEELGYIHAPVNSQGFGGLNLNSLPLARDPANAAQVQQLDDAAHVLFASWLRVSDFVTLRNSLPSSEISLIDVFSALSIDDATMKLAQVTGWDKKDIDSLVAPTGFNMNAAAFKNDVALERLQACLSLAGRLGVSASQLFSWAVLPDFTQLNAFFTQSREVAKGIQKAAHAQYEEEIWLTVAKPLNDGLRQSQRDALVAYLLPLLKFTNTNQLFEYLLIDVDMSACMQTSRVKQALSSIQLFVQRCLMNLEARDDIPAISVSPSAIDAQRWEWMKHYRVWEANRKVFLYPENWIVPELRDHKSPYFKELESELLQNEVTSDTVETAFMNYLQKLHQVARLEICGAYQQDKDPASGKDVNILHVFARTFNTPHLYFYRQWINNSLWTAWEKVPLDIEGDHLIPIIWNRRLHLLWPSFLLKTQPPEVTSISANDQIDIPELQQYWEIRLAWSELKQGKWQPKQITNSFLESQRGKDFDNTGNEPYIILAELRKHTFIASVVDGSLSVRAHVTHKDPRRVLLGEFRFDSSGVIRVGYSLNRNPTNIPLDAFEAIDTGLTYLTSLAPDPAGEVYGYEFNMWRGARYPQNPSNNSLSLYINSNGISKTFLQKARTSYRLLLPHQTLPLSPPGIQQSLIKDLYQFFYQDAQRTYFVIPVDVVEVPQVIAQADYYELEKYADFEIPLAIGIGLPDRQGPRELLSASKPSARALAGGVVLEGEFEESIFEEAVSENALSYSYFNQWSYLSLYTTTSRKLKFFIHYHPHVTAFVKSLNRDGIPGLLTVANQQLKTGPTLFWHRYEPEPSRVASPYPQEIVDFASDGAYSIYNWELFFHAPALIAARLTGNQRFAEAKKWLEYIFNPTDDSAGEPAPARFWKVLPFKSKDQDHLDEILMLLSTKDSDLSAGDLQKKKGLQQQYEELNENPFQPHLIARLRLSAYQKYVVMAYIDNLIAWGDQLFRQDTIEAINEATQLYVMAANMLGERPQELPRRGTIKPETYAGIRDKLSKGDFSDPIVAIEDAFPFSSGSGGGSGSTGGLLGIGQTLYFCIPQNKKLLSYWDTVADRLFKIRHCMNIEGVVRELALFEPPIDPALLVQAAALGVDLSSVLNDLSAPLPYYRFSYMQQKALELCGEVRSLGSAMLSALEKKDAEELSLLRATHETNILNMMEDVKKSQIDEASGQITALMKSRAVAGIRYVYYQTLLGSNGASVPGVDNNIALLPIPFKPEQDAEEGLPLLSEEQNELDASNTAHTWTMASGAAETFGAIVHAIPDFSADAHPMGVGADVKTGGSSFGNVSAAVARGLSMLSSQYSYDAMHSGKIASYQRRSQEWSQQRNLAAGEIMQIDKQIAAANIRLAIAKRDLTVHQQQIQNAQDVEALLNSKFTNQDLYAWTISDVSATYFQCYQMAYDLAKKAERAFRFERGLTNSNFVQFGYWDNLRKGLQAGERLNLALKQMERAYLDQHKREYEITKHVSLQLNNPMALIALKETGKCEIALPESLFDADYPGHYMRRIKNASLSLPCVVGPYTNINCTLTLLNNKTRITSIVGSQYVEDTENGDDRFVINFAAMQSIATSHAQNDSGMFELNFRDERYLPFEGAGVVSRWRIELPIDTNAFDLNTLTDVVMHLKYTAREGGEILKNAARKAMNDEIADSDSAPLMRMFSAKHEFPEDWYRFLHPANLNAVAQSFVLDLSRDRFPYLFRGRTLAASKINVFLNFKDSFKDNAIYRGGTALKFTMTPEGDASLPQNSLASITNILGGMPHTQISADLPLPTKLSLDMAESDLNQIAGGLIETIPSPDGGHKRLKASAVDDMLFVIHYSVTGVALGEI